MTTKSPPFITTKATTTDNGKAQTTLYASPLAQHRSLVDVSGRCSPQPVHYSSRPHSPPTSSPSVDPKGHGSLVNDGRGHRYDYQSPSSRMQERDREVQREQSPLPRIIPNESTTSNPSAAIGSLESSLSNYSLYTRRAISPRPMLGNRSQSGENSAPISFDSEHLRSLHRSSPDSSTHQRSNSAEGQQSFKRWGPYTSPVPVHRMQQRPYVPTNLSTREQNSSSGEERHCSPPLHQSKLQSDTTLIENSRHREADKTDIDRSGIDLANTDEQIRNIGFKRKEREEESTEQGKSLSSHFHFASLAPPSSHLYGDMDAARREKIGSANSADEALSKARQLSEGPPEQDELEDDDSDEARQRNTRLIDGKILALVPQRKSCDRCFKMKTKCSRAAPGASGEDACDGCIRRGYANDCVTSRPDYPYPRISLPKRARRESSLPALLDVNKNTVVYVPPSMQRGNDWRTKLIANSMNREGSEDYNHGTQQHKDRLQQSMTGKRSVTPQPLPLRSQQGHHTLQSSSRHLHGHGHGHGHGGSITTQRKESIPSNAHLSSHNSHLRSLPTSELQDLSLRIAHEVSQRSQAPSLPMTTSLIPSVTVPSQPIRPIHQSNQHQQQQGNISRAMPPNASSLGQQAMQNAPMQLLPKATGIPALQYFDQFIYPLYSLSALSATRLSQEYENYTKPGRNNIIELAMAIGLQLQGILLACPDKGQANTAEGRIFKAFIQTSKVQSDQRSTALQQGDKNQNTSTLTDSRVSIDSVKGWLEPSKHRSRAKDIVKHVMMRRCLKSGFDYDDVMETTLLGYYHLLRGEVGSYYVCLGNAQRQIALLNIHQSLRDAALWSADEIMVLRAKASAMNQLHPISLCTQMSSVSSSPTKDATIMDNDFVLLQQKLGEIASFLQTAITQTDNSKRLDVEVDDRLTLLRSSLPFLLQPFIRIEWITKDYSKIDGDWISDMIRGESMSPSLRLEVYLKICYMRLVARQSFLKQALHHAKCEGDKNEDDTLDTDLMVILRQIDHISTSVITSTMLAFTVFPQLICLSQFFAAEVTTSAWYYTINQLVLLQSASKGEEKEKVQEGLKKMQDKMTPLVEFLSASQEKESWPFATSLEIAKSIVQAARQGDDAGKEATKRLEAVRHFSSSQPQAFLRLLHGDVYAVEEFQKQTFNLKETINTAPTS